jgi:uncharacterized repeat protein (TIGR01451 family)
MAVAGDSFAAHSLIFTKTADATTVNAGAQVGYTLSLTNGGASALTQVQVTDTLPSTAGTSWSISPARPGCQISGGVLRCSFGRLAKSASASVHIVSPTTGAQLRDYQQQRVSQKRERLRRSGAGDDPGQLRSD